MYLVSVMHSGAKAFFAGAAVALGLAITIGAWITQSDLWRWADVSLTVLAIAFGIAAFVLLAIGVMHLIRANRSGSTGSSGSPDAKTSSGDGTPVGTKWEAPHRLVSIRLPQSPRPGHIEGREMVYFPMTLITKHQGISRPLRFSLTMPDRSFMDFDGFQEIYRNSPGVHSGYFSNPLDVDWSNRQRNLAFIRSGGSSGMAETFALVVHDVITGHHFVISSTGEHTLFSDGSIEAVLGSDLTDPFNGEGSDIAAPAGLRIDNVDAWSDDGPEFILQIAVHNDGPAGSFSAKLMKVEFQSDTGNADFRVPREPWFARWRGHGGRSRYIRHGDEAFLEVAIATRSREKYNVAFLTPEGKLPDVELFTMTPAAGTFRIGITIWRDDTAPSSWSAELSVTEAGFPRVQIV